MAVVVAKLDSKGRVSLPREIREIVGDVVEMKPIGNMSVLIQRADVRTNKRKNEAVDFVELNDKEPKRTGKPENPSPKEMKSIWNE
ncbi:MAG: AbrB family transcriptional regulator [Nitrososphaerales archaeon]|jgi:bifunctional DNA-binding transcriptional regulator/antitoxin component of YhaV-PrlF toxin-antitoxin module